jgi:Xaa-Pro aminopeptidase
MRTVHPSIMIGSYGWEQDRVPRDELQIRMGALNRLMDANNWKAMLVFGDAREHSALAYFSNFAPRLRWGMALLPRQGDPRLLVSMSSRDMPAMRLMTWIPDVLSAWTWESAFDPWLAGIDSGLGAEAPADIGTVRLDLMRPPLLQSLDKSLGNRFRRHAADHEVAGLRTTRPRELSLIREACAVTRAGAAAFVQAWRDGIGGEAAALAAERTARLMAAQDVRTLVSHDGGRTLEPFRGAFEAKSTPLAGYIAVKHMGYWAELFVSAADRASDVQQRTQAGLEAAVQCIGPGVAAADVYAQAIAALGGLALHPVLGGSIGRRIGFSANEGGELRPNSRHALKAGDVYALHLGAHDPTSGGAFASAMVVVTGTGHDVLVRSSDSSTTQVR